MSRFILCAAALTLLPCACFAQSNDNAPDQSSADDADQVADASSASPDTLTITFGTRALYTFEADSDRDGLDVSVWRVAGRIGFQNRVSDKMSVGVNLDHETSGYQFSGFRAALPAAEDDPFDTFHEQSLSLSVLYQLDDSWTLFLAPGINAAYESGADFGDSVTFGGIAAVGHQINKDLRIGGGVAISSELEDNTEVLPIISIDWQISERWRLTNDDRLRFINEQIGLNLIYAHDDTFSVLIGTGYRSREYRLTSDNTASDAGILEDTRFVVGAGVQWNFGRSGSLRLGGGVFVDQEFRVESSSGNELSEFESDPTGYIGVRAVLNF